MAKGAATPITAARIITSASILPMLVVQSGIRASTRLTLGGDAALGTASAV
jgi:hypothetical protein